MDEDGEADAWVRSRLDVARQGFRLHPRGRGDLTLEEYEQRLRQKVEVCLRPTAQYVGLALAAAEVLAYVEGDRLCVHRGPTAHRAGWSAYCVHVELDATDQVVSAKRDTAPWHWQEYEAARATRR